MTRQGVFVFTEDGVRFTDSRKAAAAGVEPADLVGAAYDAFICVDGERLFPRAVGHSRIRLESTGHRDHAELTALLAHHRERGAFISDARDPSAVAEELAAGVQPAPWPISLIRRVRRSGSRQLTRV